MAEKQNIHVTSRRSVSRSLVPQWGVSPSSLEVHGVSGDVKLQVERKIWLVIVRAVSLPVTEATKIRLWRQMWAPGR